MLLNLIKHKWPDIDKSYLYVQDPFKSKYQLLITGSEKVGTKKLRNSKTFIDYSQTIDDVHEKLEGYNLTKKKKKMFIEFDDMMVVMEANKKLSPIVGELLLRRRNLNILLFLHHNVISNFQNYKIIWNTLFYDENT